MDNNKVFIMAECYSDFSDVYCPKFDTNIMVFSDESTAMAYFKAKAELEKDYYLKRGCSEQELKDAIDYTGYAEFRTDNYVTIYELYAETPVIYEDVGGIISDMVRQIKS